ncbi:MAG: mechanosensitive ion channel domain-containing protein [Pseudomonadota bacterium]
MIEQLRHEPWLVALFAALLAVFAAMAAHRAGRAVLRRLFHRSPVLRSVLATVDRPAAAVLPLAALQMVWQAAQDNLPSIDAVRHANGVLLIAGLTWLATAAIRGFANGVVERHPATMEDNLHARRIQTQANVLARSAMVVVAIGGAAMALMTFPGARQLGASLLASAGVLGIIGGLAARPVFSNLIAGLQIALAQPLRIDDVLVVKDEFGRVEEITGTYVVLKLWDERRMIVPLQWFIENPFQNWTRSTSQIHQSVFLYLDFATPVEPLRAELKRIVETAPEWDRRSATLAVVDTTETKMKVRALVSAASSRQAFELGCKVREGLLAFAHRSTQAQA